MWKRWINTTAIYFEMKTRYEFFTQIQNPPNCKKRTLLILSLPHSEWIIRVLVLSFLPRHSIPAVELRGIFTVCSVYQCTWLNRAKKKKTSKQTLNEVKTFRFISFDIDTRCSVWFFSWKCFIKIQLCLMWFPVCLLWRNAFNPNETSFPGMNPVLVCKCWVHSRECPFLSLVAFHLTAFGVRRLLETCLVLIFSIPVICVVGDSLPTIVRRVKNENASNIWNTFPYDGWESCRAPIPSAPKTTRQPSKWLWILIRFQRQDKTRHIHTRNTIFWRAPRHRAPNGWQKFRRKKKNNIILYENTASECEDATADMQI